MLRELTVYPPMGQLLCNSSMKLIFIFSLLVWVVLRLRKIVSREPGLPPGPPTVPLRGNLHIFPTEYAHYRFTEWARIYGDIYSLKVGPGTAIVITSAAAVKVSMDKRSASTADRPPHYMADVVAGGLNMVLARYSDVWIVLRKNAHAMLTPNASLEHVPIQSAEAAQLIFSILSITYGKRCPRYESPEVTSFFEAQHLWALVLEPGAHPPVDLLPFLWHLPGVRKDFCKENRLQRRLYFGLLDECQARLYLGGVLIEGGSDTTSSFLQSLILALVAFPEAQRNSQEEMDRVTHRFKPVAPIAIPHGVLAAEEVSDMLIPFPYVYDESEVFNPDRYLLTEHGMKLGVDDSHFRSTLAFGSGRHICPGMHLANNSLMLHTMNLIWAFQFSPVKDPVTSAILPVNIFYYEKGILIAPRLESRVKLIKRASFDAEDVLVKFESRISAEDKDWVEKYRACVM
ncbi:cytochrome P450 [Desarmillaria ectypa]|nr:cytochrome P450 [Desarmillaria ectypa]